MSPEDPGAAHPQGPGELPLPILLRVPRFAVEQPYPTTAEPARPAADVGASEIQTRPTAAGSLTAIRAGQPPDAPARPRRRQPYRPILSAAFGIMTAVGLATAYDRFQVGPPEIDSAPGLAPEAEPTVPTDASAGNPERASSPAAASVTPDSARPTACLEPYIIPLDEGGSP